MQKPNPCRTTSTLLIKNAHCIATFDHAQPGLINTHHHMVQSLTRAIPTVRNAELFGCLSGLYPVWADLTPEPAAYTVVNGRVVVRQGQLTTVELGPLIEQHNWLARQLVQP